jgi:mannose-6-phosphate isomerase-like protein (cupin superfamily)
VERGWQVARLDEISPAWAGTEWEAIQERMRVQDPAALERWERLAEAYPDSDRTSHSVRRHFEISSFGASMYRASTGNPLVVPHDETQYGQEELYLIVNGRARYACDGDEGELDAGDLLYVRPEVHRELFALETPTTVFVAGGVPGRAYAAPSWAPDYRPPAA